MDVSLLLGWAEMLLRWAHVISGIAWIGTSFYFVALDAGLQPASTLPQGVLGESWQVHGGGFYHIQKYGVAPAALPQRLTWFEWEAYTTWIFGFALLVLIYFLHPRLYLIDSSVLALSPLAAVLIASLGIGLGYLVYDLLCRSPLGQNDAVLAAVGFAFLSLAAWGFAHLFSGRGAYIEIGSLVGSIMVGNVFFVIIPNQKVATADLIAGRQPEARLGKEAKQRSLHNNYLTLPVVFLMLSNHYAFTFGSRLNWLVLAAVFIAGFLIRYFFNALHTTGQKLWWTWPAAAVPIALAFLISALGSAPQATSSGPVSFAQVQAIIHRRCAVCHAAHPAFAGFSAPPMGIIFETPAEIVARAQQIYALAVATHTMPLNNITKISPAERAAIGAWVRAGAKTP